MNKTTTAKKLEQPTPFYNDVEKAIKQAISKLDSGTVGISRDNLWQLTRIVSTVGPVGTNAAFYAREVFDAIVSRAPYCNFVYRD